MALHLLRVSSYLTVGVALSLETVGYDVLALNVTVTAPLQKAHVRAAAGMRATGRHATLTRRAAARQACTMPSGATPAGTSSRYGASHALRPAAAHQPRTVTRLTVVVDDMSQAGTVVRAVTLYSCMLGAAVMWHDRDVFHRSAREERNAELIRRRRRTPWDC